MKTPTLRQTGIAALVLLLPGGLILGAALAARGYNKRKKDALADPETDREQD
jgi:Na+/melibiose symporter-like transporter